MANQSHICTYELRIVRLFLVVTKKKYRFIYKSTNLLCCSYLKRGIWFGLLFFLSCVKYYRCNKLVSIISTRMIQNNRLNKIPIAMTILIGVTFIALITSRIHNIRNTNTMRFATKCKLFAMVEIAKLRRKQYNSILYQAICNVA